MNRFKIFLFSFVSLFSACHIFHGQYRNEAHISTVNNNVCKKLTEKVVLYAIFVDSRYTNPWSTFDISSTTDSINKAICWIEKQAKERGINLDIELDFHQDSKKIIPIETNLPRKTLSASLFTSTGVNIRNIDRWADKVGKKALQIYGTDTSTITKTKIKPKDRERLIARIRDIHKTDNVALMYFINNYYTDEISVALHIGSDQNPEYSVVSFKKPSVIAHEFLHLFGALDLYISPFDKKRKARKKKDFVMKNFPNEIMAFPYRSLDSLSISPLTEYLLSWDNELSKEHQQMLFGKKIKAAKY
ncbi:MAG: hypothetical protein RIC95_07095 [Vicingaceae bacterium]